jgi:hypothetical protein
LTELTFQVAMRIASDGTPPRGARARYSGFSSQRGRFAIAAR